MPSGFDWRHPAHLQRRYESLAVGRAGSRDAREIAPRVDITATHLAALVLGIRWLNSRRVTCRRASDRVEQAHG